MFFFRHFYYDIYKKIYEHRKVFPDEPVKAYIYVSKSIQAICGVMYLSNKTSLLDWREMYKEDVATVKRIDVYLPIHKFGMEINRFEYSNSIPIVELRQNLDKFIIPQMYYYIEDLDLLRYIEANIEFDGIVIIHEYDNTTSEMICRS